MLYLELSSRKMEDGRRKLCPPAQWGRFLPRLPGGGEEVSLGNSEVGQPNPFST